MNRLEGGVLERLDLNLLRLLDALRTEGSVSNAARRLRITQSGASRALGRLREAFGDPLCVLANGRLVLTPYAERVAEHVRVALELLADGVARPEFDPACSERTFVLAMGDYCEALLLPALSAALIRHAPNVRIETSSALTEIPNRLARGGADLGICITVPDDPGLCASKLFRDEFATVVRAQHPILFGLGVTRESCLGMHHLVLAPEPGLLEADAPRVAASLSAQPTPVRPQGFLAAAFLITQSDAVLTLPRLLALQLERSMTLQIVSVDFGLPEFEVYMFWHERSRMDPGHHWFRRLLRDVTSSFTSHANLTHARESCGL